MNIKNTIFKLQTSLAAAKQWQRILVVVVFLAALLGLGWKGYDYYLGSQRDVTTIVPYNHSDTTIDKFYVDGSFGGNVYPHEGGGSSMCCVTIPRRWHTELKMTVKWLKDGSDLWFIKDISVPQYDDQGGEIQVHFFNNDNVKVIITNYGLRSPLNPLHDELLVKKHD